MRAQETPAGAARHSGAGPFGTIVRAIRPTCERHVGVMKRVRVSVGSSSSTYRLRLCDKHQPCLESLDPAELT